MPALISDLVIVFSGASVGPEGRAELAVIKTEARVLARQVLSRMRTTVRQHSPVQTSRMKRSFRVKSTKAPRGGVAQRLTTGDKLFYAAFTNTHNRATLGWFDTLTERELAANFATGPLRTGIDHLARRFAAIAARRILKQFLGRRLTGQLQITGAGFHIRPVSLGNPGSGSTGVLNFNIG